MFCDDDDGQQPKSRILLLSPFVFPILKGRANLLSLTLPSWWMWLQSSSQSQIKIILPVVTGDVALFLKPFMCVLGNPQVKCHFSGEVGDLLPLWSSLDSHSCEPYPWGPLLAVRNKTESSSSG